jgi:glycosyltransferase involved in cell wall biosynthesis
LKKISVVIPCFNEVNTIEHVVSQVRNSPVTLEIEIIAVDDFSTDGSRALLAELLENGHINNLILQDRNRGKGAALRAGFQACTGGIVIVQDADLECDPAEYPVLIAPILDGTADVVYGSRFLLQAPRPVFPFWRTKANAFLTHLSNMFSNIYLTDMETCYKVFKSEVIQGLTLKENRFGFEPEVTARIARLPIKIVEVPISYNARSVADGKKIGLRDAFRTVYAIVRYNLFH